MKLLTEAIRRQLPPLRATENDPDPLAVVKFFTPWSNWAWFVTEFDGEDVFFGYVCGFEREWGYFNLVELEGLRGPWGQRVERDSFFSPTRVSQLKKND